MQVRPVQATIIEEAPRNYDSELRRKYKVPTKVPTIVPGMLEDFAENLVNLRKTLDQNRYHAVIVPLRGGLKPWVQLDVSGQHHDTVIWLPYTGASQRKMDERIRWYLRRDIAPFTEEAELRLAVVDTGEGGNGSTTLAELIHECHKQDTRRRWLVDIHLIYQSVYPPLSRSIPNFSNDKLHFNPYPWKVQSLIMED
jgi:hypothetical protein